MAVLVIIVDACLSACAAVQHERGPRTHKLKSRSSAVISDKSPTRCTATSSLLPTLQSTAASALDRPMDLRVATAREMPSAVQDVVDSALSKSNVVLQHEAATAPFTATAACTTTVNPFHVRQMPSNAQSDFSIFMSTTLFDLPQTTFERCCIIRKEFKDNHIVNE